MRSSSRSVVSEATAESESSAPDSVLEQLSDDAGKTHPPTAGLFVLP